MKLDEDIRQLSIYVDIRHGRCITPNMFIDEKFASSTLKWAENRLKLILDFESMIGEGIEDVSAESITKMREILNSIQT